MKVFKPKEKSAFHFAGVNCFHFAVGYPYPVVIWMDDYPDVDLFFVKLVPGGSAMWQNKLPYDQEGFARHVLKACRAEGIQVCRRYPAKRPGYQTLAVFAHGGQTPDFHFAREISGGRWVEKLPAHKEKKYASFQELRKARPDYPFVSFLSSPKNLVPCDVRSLTSVDLVHARTSDGRATDPLLFTVSSDVEGSINLLGDSSVSVEGSGRVIQVFNELNYAVLTPAVRFENIEIEIDTTRPRRLGCLTLRKQAGALHR